MPIVALLAIHHGRSDVPEQPRALLRVGGRSLLERSVRQVRGAGAERVILFADPTVPCPPLDAEVASLRAAYPTVDIVETGHALAGLVSPTDTVLLVEEGVLVDPTLILACLDNPGRAALAVWPVEAEAAANASRLEADNCFASVAKLPGDLVRKVARGLGEWDLEQTMVHAALGEGAARYVRAETILGDSRGLGWRPLHTQADADVVTKELIKAARQPAPDAISRWLLGPIESVLVGFAARRSIGSLVLWLVGLILGVFAAPAFASGWIWAGLALAVAALLLASIGDRLALISMERPLTGVAPNIVRVLLYLAWGAAIATHIDTVLSFWEAWLPSLMLLAAFGADWTARRATATAKSGLWWRDGQASAQVAWFASSPAQVLTVFGGLGSFLSWPAAWIGAAIYATASQLIVQAYAHQVLLRKLAVHDERVAASLRAKPSRWARLFGRKPRGHADDANPNG
jgi:1L-myo-inositol 1-phosphate cytidylyltransferase / CDP-L-myo-inositol myo-inositolphosphotransferase